MHILLSNDDGIDAPGLHALEKKLRPSHRLSVVAPMIERSTTGHTLSLDHPLKLEERGEKRWACSGYPADCVFLGLSHLLKQDRPDIVVSGINRGANLGQDCYYSGTIAAAREASFHRTMSMALSLVYRKGDTHFLYETASQIAFWILEFHALKLLPAFSVLNVNVPNVEISQIQGFTLTTPGFRHYSEEVEERKDPRGRSYYWIAGHLKEHEMSPGTDAWAVAHNQVALTVLGIVPQAPSPEWTERVGEMNERYFS
jgi:5'-nucleotidase